MTETYAEGIELKCPYCQKRVRALTKPMSMLLHEMPPCEGFEKLEPDEFLSVARQKITGEVS